MSAKHLRKLLQERRLTWDDVALAAYVGHRGARAACKGQVPAPGSVWSESQKLFKKLFSSRRGASWRDGRALSRIGDWTYGLTPWGKIVQLRAALAAAELALPKFEAKVRRDRAPRRAIAAAGAVLERGRRVQSRTVLAACRAALESARKAARARGFAGDLMPGHCAPYDAACAANQAAKLAHLILTVKVPSEPLAASLMSLPFAFVTSRAVRYAAGAASPSRVTAAVQKALLKTLPLVVGK